MDLSQQKNKVRLAQIEIEENLSFIQAHFIEAIKTSAWPFNYKTNLHLPSSLTQPNIAEKKWLADAADWNVSASKAQYWPSLDLTLSYQESPWRDAAKSSNSSIQYSGLLTLTLPIWSRFETSSAVSSSRTVKILADNDLRKSKKQYEEQFKFLEKKIALSRENLSEADKNLTLAKKLYEDYLRSFKIGRISTNDLFLEQARLISSESLLTESLLAFHQSIVSLCVLQGQNLSSCLQNSD